MTWMNKAAGRFPVYLAEARGATVVDLDGHRYVDLCLGDTAAMAGHSPEATVAAVRRRYAEAGGATAMLPTEDAAWVGAELARRFGVPLWSFSLTATDANRWAIRLARLVTGRPKILVFNYCYHGTVDESFVTLGRDGAASREGNVGPPVDPAATTRVVEFNDLDALDRELANGDVACVLMEPALTNIGIVLPAPGYLEGVRELTRRHGTLLVNDETHTLSAGPGGCTLAWGLEPDLVTVGKAIAGGIAAGAYGVSAEVAERVAGRHDADLIDTGGVGGTLAGNALSVAAMRATLEQRPHRPGLRAHDRAGDHGSPTASRGSSTPAGCPGRWCSWGPGPSTASPARRRSTAASRPPPATTSSTTTCTCTCTTGASC